ncbi:unnamed protein product [Protopolystoma xenopodis]|uniref:Uncharacterized protein n=1 Tax=Protopolystoma xenopodis TaxID=117903 RepID=A0A448XEX8_9PLAT|nr:unnamed protein product [Protopolystoma xenopodis]
MCDSDKRPLSRSVLVSRNRLTRIWQRLEEPLIEIKDRIEVAVALYTNIDSVSSRFAITFLLSSN